MDRYITNKFYMQVFHKNNYETEKIQIEKRMGISFYTDWDKANQNDSEAQEHEVIEDLTAAFLTVV